MLHLIITIIIIIIIIIIITHGVSFLKRLLLFKIFDRHVYLIVILRPTIFLFLLIFHMARFALFFEADYIE